MMNKLYFYCLALFVAPTFSAFGQTQPSQDENGYYLIESAEHLKWFRDQVNASEHQCPFIISSNFTFVNSFLKKRLFFSLFSTFEQFS